MHAHPPWLRRQSVALPPQARDAETRRQREVMDHSDTIRKLNAAEAAAEAAEKAAADARAAAESATAAQVGRISPWTWCQVAVVFETQPQQTTVEAAPSRSCERCCTLDHWAPKCVMIQCWFVTLKRV
jgi:hypothetical protein